MTNINIPIKCSTCKYYAVGFADGESSLDRSSVRSALCTKHITYDIVCPKSCRKNGCKDYHLNWNIYNKMIKNKNNE
jgi:hypothetical protein